MSYADATTVYQSGPNADNLIINTNHELILLYDWLCANKLSLNVKKTNWCIFSPQNSNFEVNLNITINNEIISQIGIRNNEETVKFLGIYIDPHITWKKHVNSVSSKMAKAIIAINKVKHFLPHIALRSLYLTLVQSHIIYGIQLWGNGNTKKLEILQKRAVRMINNLDIHGTITRRYDDLLAKRTRTRFSSKLPKDHFTKIWNDINNNTRTTVHKTKFKSILSRQFLGEYLSQVHCSNPRCIEGNNLQYHGCTLLFLQAFV